MHHIFLKRFLRVTKFSILSFILFSSAHFLHCELDTFTKNSETKIVTKANKNNLYLAKVLILLLFSY